MEITITKITSTDIIFMVGVMVAAIGVIATIIRRDEGTVSQKPLDERDACRRYLESVCRR